MSGDVRRSADGRRGSATVEDGDIEHDLRMFEDVDASYENSRGVFWVAVVVASLITGFNRLLFLQLVRSAV